MEGSKSNIEEHARRDVTFGTLCIIEVISDLEYHCTAIVIV
jgi:hypothetical protein